MRDQPGQPIAQRMDISTEAEARANGIAPTALALAADPVIGKTVVAPMASWHEPNTPS